MKREYGFLSLIIVFILSVSGCVETPDEIISPVWDINLSIPVTSRIYTLEDAIKGEENLVASTDPSSLGLIYYIEEKELKSIFFKDELKVDDFGVLSSQSVGTIKLNDLNPVEANIPIQQWTNQIIPGQTQIFPPQQGNLNEPFDRIDEFEEVTFDEGIMDLTIHNNLPVDIVLEGIVIRNIFDESIIAEIPSSPSSNWITIPIEDSVVISFDLQDKTIMNEVEILGVLTSPGSGGGTVSIPQDAGTRVVAKIRDGSKIRKAFAPLPPQDPFAKDSALLIDDSVQPTQLKNALFRDGYFDIDLTNNLDLDVSVNIQIHNLLKNGGAVYDITVDLNRKEKNKLIREPQLAGWKVVNPGGPTEFLNSTITVFSDGSTQPRLIEKTDNILVEMNFHELKFVSVEGRIAPTDISFENSEFTLDLGDLKDRFGFDELSFNDPSVSIHFRSTADLETQMDAVVTGSNGNQQGTMTITELIIPPLANTKRDLNEYGFKEFINGFQNNFPTDFFVSGTAIGNPNYNLGNVHQDDSIYSSLIIELPFDLGISGGRIVDTFDVDLGTIDESELKRVNYGVLTIECENTVPVEMAFTAESLDSLNNLKLSIPPRPVEPQNVDYIKINSPQVNSNGNVVAPATTISEVTIFNDEIRLFLANKKLAVRFEFLTPPASNLNPVKFRVTDLLKLKIYANLSYRVDLD